MAKFINCHFRNCDGMENLTGDTEHPNMPDTALSFDIIAKLKEWFRAYDTAVNLSKMLSAVSFPVGTDAYGITENFSLRRSGHIHYQCFSTEHNFPITAEGLYNMLTGGKLSAGEVDRLLKGLVYDRFKKVNSTNLICSINLLKYLII